MYVLNRSWTLKLNFDSKHWKARRMLRVYQESRKNQKDRRRRELRCRLGEYSIKMHTGDTLTIFQPQLSKIEVVRNRYSVQILWQLFHTIGIPQLWIFASKKLKMRYFGILKILDDIPKFDRSTRNHWNLNWFYNRRVNWGKMWIVQMRRKILQW